MDNKKRCFWCGDSEIYQQYHDREWGVPQRDESALFELLNLEGAQAGLSWITILKKRENYREAFDGFDPQKIACYSESKIECLLSNPGIIRNRLKVNAFVVNAQQYLHMQQENESFRDYLWSFVSNKPIQNSWKTSSEIPATTKQSDAMSQSLKKRGFKFVGPTICYAFMQSAGMVNDHIVGCFRYGEV